MSTLTEAPPPAPAEHLPPRRDRRATSLFEPAIVRRAVGRRLLEARPPDRGPQPGHVRGVRRRGVDHGAVLPGPESAPPRPPACSGAWWPCGCGSRCCSPTSPRRWPKGGARPRLTRCARPARRPSPMSSRPTARPSTRPSSALSVGDEVVCNPGDLIPGDGDVIEGIAAVDESAITGESAPVIRESGGDRSSVTGGTRVLSDRIVVRITAQPGESFIDRMIALVEGADRQKTPNEIALNILLAGLTIAFVLAVATLQPFAIYSSAHQSIIVLVGPAGVPGPDHHQRPAVGYRHRRHGPPRAAQRAGHVRPSGRGSRGRIHAAVGQDRHHHLRQPHGLGVPPGRRPP